MALADDVTALQARLAAAQRERNRAEGARDTAKSVAEAARDELQRDYGVTTVAEGEALLSQLRDELEDLAKTIASKLDEIGVS